MSIGTIILLGMGSQDLLVTLGYGSGIAQPPSPPPIQPVSEHWGHWPLIRRRISTSSAYSEETVEELVEEVEEKVEEEVREVIIHSLPFDWDRILDNALQKIQAKIEAEIFVDVKARKEERRRAALAARKELERLQEEELIQVLFMINL